MTTDPREQWIRDRVLDFHYAQAQRQVQRQALIGRLARVAAASQLAHRMGRQDGCWQLDAITSTWGTSKPRMRWEWAR